MQQAKQSLASFNSQNRPQEVKKFTINHLKDDAPPLKKQPSERSDFSFEQNSALPANHQVGVGYNSFEF
jgi:hypothetical protein